jgi:two-component system CheB/CheR fusion protein
MPPTDPQFEALLVYLKEARGFDFTGYKRSSLVRRVDRRMMQVSVTDYGEYLDHLQVRQEEFTALFNTILINVTAFFRDPEAWQYLRTEVLEPMVAAKPADAPLRLWSAGCASGEEAYTLAMLMTEIIGPDELRRRVKIYATDVDEEQLSEARQASYGEQQIVAVPPELLGRYFEPAGNRFVFRKDLRRSVIFGRNDLVQDAPISRIDVLACRNTLMYFNAETQARILNRFHVALNNGGSLFLGKAELLLSHATVFTPADLKRRVFRKVDRPGPANGAALPEPAGDAGRPALVRLDELRGEAFQANPVAQIVVTSDGLVALTNRQADAHFGVSSRDVGRPFRDLDVSYRPAELRRYIEQAQLERRPLHLSDIEHVRTGGETQHLEIQVSPLVSGDSGLLGVALAFHDVTAARRLREELEHTNGELETAYEELQSTVEELETTNEELQSTIEELETANEELQSTNEELETMNEELQSTNDELHRINERLHASTAELDRANVFLDAILASLQAGVVVVDRDLQIRVWNRRAENLWGLRDDEVMGRHLLNLDIGLPVDRLGSMLEQTLAGGAAAAQVRLPAVNRRGRSIMVRVASTPLTELSGETTGAIIAMEADEPAPAPIEAATG